MKLFNKKFNKTTKLIIITIYLIPLIIGAIFFFRSLFLGQILLLAELIIFNGIAITYIIIIFVGSFIKFSLIENCKMTEEGLVLFSILITWSVAFIAAFTIVLVYSKTSLINNVIIDFFSIFLTFIIFSAMIDIGFLSGGI